MTEANYSAGFAIICLASAAIALIVSAGAGRALAQSAQEAVPPLPKEYVLLTIFLRHGESNPLSEIEKDLRQRNWMRDFPPQGVEAGPGTS